LPKNKLIDDLYGKNVVYIGEQIDKQQYPWTKLKYSFKPDIWISNFNSDIWVEQESNKPTDLKNNYNIFIEGKLFSNLSKNQIHGYPQMKETLGKDNSFTLLVCMKKDIFDEEKYFDKVISWTELINLSDQLLNDDTFILEDRATFKEMFLLLKNRLEFTDSLDYYNTQPAFLHEILKWIKSRSGIRNTRCRIMPKEKDQHWKGSEFGDLKDYDAVLNKDEDVKVLYFGSDKKNNFCLCVSATHFNSKYALRIEQLNKVDENTLEHSKVYQINLSEDRFCKVDNWFEFLHVINVCFEDGIPVDEINEELKIG